MAQRFVGKYALFSCIEIVRDPEGRYFTDALWLKDLLLHLDYLPGLALAAPCRHGRPKPNQKLLSGDGVTPVRVLPLPFAASVSSGLLRLPKTNHQISNLVREADIVHLGVVGWPLPLGWIAAFHALRRGRFLVVVIESAPWRATTGGFRRWRDRLRAAIFEPVARTIVRRADLAVFTHAGYRAQLADPWSVQAHVVPASWIDDDLVLTPAEARGWWQQKASRTDRRLHVIHAGRLTAAKGTGLLLDAWRDLRDRRAPVSLDLIGVGPLREMAQQLAATSTPMTRLRVLDPVEYGSPFAELLRQYDMLAVPTISDEQPRVIYDAYAQAVPVLASDTAGNRQCVNPEETGWLVPRGDRAALTNQIAALAEARDGLADLGMAGLAIAVRMTHSAMHEERKSVLLEAWQKSPKSHATRR